MEYIVPDNNMIVRSFHLVELSIEEEVPLRNHELHVDGHGFNRLLDTVGQGQHIASSKIITDLMPGINNLKDTLHRMLK